ncbi:MAG: hypothetical protein WC538_07465 [Thermoanaerobaculia bacterium]|jgi:hypothetical protein
MKEPLIVATCLMATALFGFGSEKLSPFHEKTAPTLEFDVRIQPVEHDQIQLLGRPGPGKYRCSVVVAGKPGSRVAVGTEDIIIGPGEKRTATFEHDGLRLLYTVELGQSAEFARTLVELTRDGTTIGRQHSTIYLGRRSSSRDIEPALP